MIRSDGTLRRRGTHKPEGGRRRRKLEYECRSTTTEIDSIARRVTDATRVYPPKTRQFGFDFEREQAADVFGSLVGAGFFATSRNDNRTTWNEVAPAEPVIRQVGDRIDVSLSGGVPIVEVRSSHGPSLSFRHTLKARRGAEWTEARWYEPLNRRPSEDEKALATAGKRLRALAKNNLTNSTDRPACL